MIDLEKIIYAEWNCFQPITQIDITLNPDKNKIKSAMKEAIRQALELAASEATTKNVRYSTDVEVDKESITDVINQIK